MPYGINQSPGLIGLSNASEGGNTSRVALRNVAGALGALIFNNGATVYAPAALFDLFAARTTLRSAISFDESGANFYVNGASHGEGVFTADFEGFDRLELGSYNNSTWNQPCYQFAYYPERLPVNELAALTAPPE